MRVHVLALAALTGVLLSAEAARAEVCLAIDAARDTLAERDRDAAILLIAREFEAAGERVVPAGCDAAYSIAHAQLGNTIVVHVERGGKVWDAVAQGTDDLPAVYSQLVRSIVTGRPLTGLSVVDRTNVTESQTNVRRVSTDSIWYARLGYGVINGDRAYGLPSIGFGYRAELDAFAIDVGFLNFQFGTPNGYSGSRSWSHTLLKLSALRYISPRENRSAYFGGGVSYGRTEFGDDSYRLNLSSYRSDWSGNGLQGELTAGYELARATSMRLFVQADAVLPFYQVTSETFQTTTRFGPPTVTSDRRYAPSFVVSIGLGR